MTGNKQTDKPQKYVIIHGHFYQPPRENPWINRIEQQASAAPSHDWNERIYDQCYRPNAYSRLLDPNGMITDIYNNYARMSFNFGPTLFSWFEQFHPATLKRIAESDAESCRTLDGHGNAVAQVYNHIIMPLSSRRDKLTQIRWAKHDFQKHFSRDPEGIWLAETAINMETVGCLIEENIKFVILSPSQVESFRPMQESAQWISATNHGIDVRRTYRIFHTSPDGKRLPGFLDVFLFDEGLSKEISFGDLLKDAHVLGNRIRSSFSENSITDQVVTIATDGETFGHHKPFGDMCLAFFFRNLADKFDIVPVNFGYYLSKNPPKHEVLLKNAYGEGTAWSCAHGVGRWVRDCGCKTGGEGKWKQTWRGPMRTALENLQKKIDAEFEAQVSKFGDPWLIRDKYITASNTVSWKKFKVFLEKNLDCTSLDKKHVFAFRRLLEAQKYTLFSFTSCGWFFSDISGIESIQNLAYACRALQLGLPEPDQKQALEEFLVDLEKAPSNLPNANGRTLFEKHILSYYDHGKILAFTAAALKALGGVRQFLFDLFSYSVQLEQVLTIKKGALSYHGFNLEMESETTGETGKWSILISNKDNSEIMGWIIPYIRSTDKKTFRPEMWLGHSEAVKYDLNDLFSSSQQEFTSYFLQKISRDTDTRFSIWMKNNERELDLLSSLSIPLPSYCTAPLTYVVQEQWNRLIARLETRGKEKEVFAELLELSRSIERFSIPIDFQRCAGTLENLLISELTHLSEKLNEKYCERVRFLLNLVDRFSIPVPKHKLEDLFYPILNRGIREFYEELNGEDPADMKRKRDGKKALLIVLLSFARRMNFNTEAFNITEDLETSQS